MKSSTFHLVFIGFLALAGYSLGWAIRLNSIVGIVSSGISLAAGAYFLYLRSRMEKELKKATNRATDAGY
jgi:type IV secretory pathway VirB2 component (pilin)